MSQTTGDVAASWEALVESLAEAGRRMDDATRRLGPEERADGFRALARALSNQLGRFEAEMMRRAAPKVLKSREAAEQLHCAAATRPANTTRAAAVVAVRPREEASVRTA